MRSWSAAPPAPGTMRASSSASRPATSPNWLNRSSCRAVFAGIHASGSKSSTWAATCERNGLGSNRSMRVTGERPRRRPARNASTPVPAAVMMPMPVIQTRRRAVVIAGSPTARPRARPRFRDPATGAVATASAIALNVASVRPAIGRVNQRSTTRASPGSRGAKSCSIRTWQPVAVGSMCQVTSMPRVAPATWTNRRRRAAGSAHVRERHATGRPMPRIGTSGRRAMKSTTSVASGRRSRAVERA